MIIATAIAVCCSVLQYVVVCCNVLTDGLYIHDTRNDCRSVLQCVAVCYSVLQCDDRQAIHT